LYICWKKRCDVINKWKGHDCYVHINENLPKFCATLTFRTVASPFLNFG
jgi:hypothetical protein